MSARPGSHTNSEGERLEIRRATSDAFKDQMLLIVHDDPWPVGSGVEAPMLLDEGTVTFLLEHLSPLAGL